MTKPITLPIISFTVCVLCLFQYCRYIFVPCNKTITKLWWLIPIETFQFSQQLKQQLRIKMFNINYMFINFLFLYVIILHLDQYFDILYLYNKYVEIYSKVFIHLNSFHFERCLIKNWKLWSCDKKSNRDLIIGFSNFIKQNLNWDNRF